MTGKSFKGGRSVVARIVHGAVLGSAAAVLCLVFSLTGGFDRWEAVSWNWRASLLARPGPASDQVKLVLVDQESLDWALRENGLTWPWPREVYAVITDFLRRQGARAIAFDVLFTEPSSFGVEDDQRFGTALEAARRVVVPVSLGASGTRADNLPEAYLQTPFRVEGLEQWLGDGNRQVRHTRGTFPTETVAAKALILANVHVEPEKNGVFQRVNLIDIFADRAFPTLGLGNWAAGNPEEKITINDEFLAAGSHRVPIDSRGRALLRFRGPAGTHQSFSAAAVIQSELRLRAGLEPTISGADVFRDKYVFIGFSAPGLADLHPVPTDSAFPGVEVHATFLDNLLSGDFLVQSPGWQTVLMTFLMAVLTGVVVSFTTSPALLLALTPAGLVIPIALSLGAYASGFWLPLIQPEASGALTMIFTLVGNFFFEGRQKHFIKSAFKQYLSHAVIEQLLANPEKLKLGGERRTISILFSDLEGFTSISESLEPEILTAMLNDYLTAMTEIITEEGGTVDKYEGDAIIAFWNAPVAMPDHAERAMRAALRCQARLAEMRPGLKKRVGRDLRMRIGLNTGPAIVGNMGSHTRFNYTMIGDAVNLAARLEGANKEFGTYTLVSAASCAEARGHFQVRELGRIIVAGKNEPVSVYELLSTEEFDQRSRELRQFALGLESYYAGEFARACEIFSVIAENDPPARSYLGHCRSLLDAPPQQWQGARVLTGKG